MSELTKQIIYNAAKAPAETCGKDDNHTAIYSAICDIESAILNADSLLARIRMSAIEEPNMCSSEGPSLVEILQCGPDMIAEKTAKLNSTIDEIRLLLF